MINHIIEVLQAMGYKMPYTLAQVLICGIFVYIIYGIIIMSWIAGLVYILK